MVAFSVLGEEPAKDLENFVEKGYPFVLDADVTSVNNPTDIIKYLLKWKETKYSFIIEIIDGGKLADVQDLRFRYSKISKGKDLTLATKNLDPNSSDNKRCARKITKLFYK